MNQIKLSVCISVHNTEEYLSRCLDSVVNQTLNSLEIVLVNNGSSDNSENIMRQYQSLYPERRILVISQEDMGLAQGRQTGINNASGEYIAFLDADDYVTNDAYEKMIKYADENKVDIVEAETIRGKKRISAPFSGVHSTQNVLSAYFWGEQTLYPMLWMRIYKRTLFKRKVLPDLYVNNEDIFAFPCLLYEAQTIGYIKEELHVYSVDNEKAIMIELVKKQDMADKYYENRKKTLKAIPHIESFIGKSMPREFTQYKQRLILNFLKSDIYGVTYEDKISYIKEELEFNNNNEVIRFIRKNALAKTRINVAIKLLGVKNYYYLRNFIKKIINLV